MFYFSNGKPKVFTMCIVLWTLVHGVLAWNGFYEKLDTTPPRFIIVLIPVLLMIGVLFNKKHLKTLVENRDLKVSTFLHVLRIPMEIILLYLMIYGLIPELMTFEGRNFDIIAGITAPLVGYLFVKGKLSKKSLLVWNIIGLFLILFIVVNALLSAELPIQQFAFDQPNKAVMLFPYMLLPATVVPIVIFTHVIDIVKLLRES